jgi:hypothetical protein
MKRQLCNEIYLQSDFYLQNKYVKMRLVFVAFSGKFLVTSLVPGKEFN